MHTYHLNKNRGNYGCVSGCFEQIRGEIRLFVAKLNKCDIATKAVSLASTKKAGILRKMPAYGVGKLPTSRRYNQLPLLRSSPGGFIRSWPYRTYPYCVQRYNKIPLLQNLER